MRWLAALLLAALVTAPLASPQGESNEHLLDDDAGDVQLSLYDQSTPMPGGWDAVDLLHLSVMETHPSIQFVLGVAGFPDCQADTCSNSGDTRTYFNYGEKRYEIQLGIDLTGNPYAQFWEVISGDFNRQLLAQLTNTADPELFTYTVDVPRELIIDENGSPPRKDTALSNIFTRAYSQTSFGGPDPADPTNPDGADMLVTSDTMGMDAPGAVDLLLGGSASEGPVTLSSPLPYRASNGGAATYRFDLRAVQSSEVDVVYDFELEGIPNGWTVNVPEGKLRLAPGTPIDFSILIETPFGHQHGGSDAFTARLTEANGPSWAEVELGIHYVALPHISGHHPSLYFHSQPIFEPFGTLNTALGGLNGLLVMNTLDDDPGDQQTNVQGSTGAPTNDVFRWWLCLQPELLMGIDMNMSETGTLTFPLDSTRPFADSVLSGTLYHLGAGNEIQGCFPGGYADRTATAIATIPATTPFTVSGSTSVEADVLPLDTGDYISFEPGTTLVLEVFVDAGDLPVGPGPSGPGGMELVPGGSITLPLDEYHDARPAGVVGWSGNMDDIAKTPLGEDGFEQDPVKESPASAVLLLPALGIALAAGRAANGRKLDQ